MQIDGDESPRLAQRFGVRGFPSIFYLQDEETWEFTGHREEAEVGPPLTHTRTLHPCMGSSLHPSALQETALHRKPQLPTVLSAVRLLLQDHKSFSGA